MNQAAVEEFGNKSNACSRRSLPSYSARSIFVEYFVKSTQIALNGLVIHLNIHKSSNKTMQSKGFAVVKYKIHPIPVSNISNISKAIPM